MASHRSPFSVFIFPLFLFHSFTAFSTVSNVFLFAFLFCSFCRSRRSFSFSIFKADAHREQAKEWLFDSSFCSSFLFFFFFSIVFAAIKQWQNGIVQMAHKSQCVAVALEIRQEYEKDAKNVRLDDVSVCPRKNSITFGRFVVAIIVVVHAILE